MEIMGVEAEIVCDEQRLRPDDSEMMRLIAATPKGEHLAGRRPAVSLKDGLAKTIEFVKEHVDLYKANICNV